MKPEKKERDDVGQSGASVPSKDVTTRLVDASRLNAAKVYPEYNLTDQGKDKVQFAWQFLASFVLRMHCCHA